MTAGRDLVDRVRQYCRLQDIDPDDDDARVPVVAGAVGGDPDRVRAVLDDLADAPEGDSRDAPPTPESDNPTSTSTTSDTAEIETETESYPTESDVDADCGVTKTDQTEEALAPPSDDPGLPGEPPGVDTGDPVESDDNALSTAEIRGHYRRVADVYDALATQGDDETVTQGVADKADWYRTRPVTDVEDVEAGWTHLRRPHPLDDDLHRLTDGVDRTLYALTSYKRRPTVTRWTRAKDDDSDADGEFTYDGGENPNPPAEAIRAVGAWGDIDLRDDLKLQRGTLDARTRVTAERTLEAYADEFAALYGGHDAVYGLDSVGGAYLFGAPEAFRPALETVPEDADERDVLVRAFIDRTNDWLRDAQERVEDRVAGAADVIDPDWANNINRQYKAPLSLHGDHDAVVTPLDTQAVDYRKTPLDDVDDALVADARQWADDLTADEHRDRVAHLVDELWPEHTADTDGWRDALRAFLDERMADERAPSAADVDRVDLEAYEPAATGTDETTADARDVFAALDRLDARDVADRTIVHRWNDSASTSGNNQAFAPTWGPEANGTANIVNREIWQDTGGVGGYGGPTVMAAIDAGLVTHRATPRDVAGETWVKAVDHLRSLGFDVPTYDSSADTDTDGGDRSPAVVECAPPADDLEPADVDAIRARMRGPL